MKLSENAKIAIVRLSALGDVCHAMSVVTAIRKRYPNAEITWITGKLEADLVSMMPDIKIVTYQKSSGLKGMLAIRKQFINESFDVLLHMQWSSRASLLTRMLKAKTRIGFAKSHSREKQHWFVNTLAPEPRGRHVLDTLMSMAEAIDVPHAKPSWQLEVPKRQTELPNDYIIINPCGSKVTKNWTLEGYRKLIEHLISKGEKVVLTGGPTKTEIEFVKAIAQGYELDNLVGKTSIKELTAVIRDAKLIISPDTGPVHIATVVNTPMVGLYALSNPERTGPYYGQASVVSVYQMLAEKEYGKPISDIPWASTVHDPEAMSYISYEAVLEKVNNELEDLN
ncbi:lipopolysaccharide biosynthesis protein [Marinomonas sp. SBI22]|uniref:glycosyltransferase family 9 protein n=1 Tax=unclassified Marinomonas TaxID=196814 RepID=UPI0007AF88D1|nr:MULTISPECIES: glycosyltransferase family 9 protein [unclassified Marinomonas]KZM38952.1 lipopolysaccharide biosynthesis protein [Marinomonas sp. SBI22]KZM39639.1 lipopolysaccharide biosynthesis protein [Marinomonas sp. SBI8L]